MNKGRLLLMALLLGQMLYSQGRYTNEVRDLLAVTAPGERGQALSSYLGAINDSDLADAVADISTLGDYNFVAYELLGRVRDRLAISPIFKARLHDKIRANDNPTHFRVVAIDFIQSSMVKEEEVQAFETTLYEIAVDRTIASQLRGYAAGRLGGTINVQLSRNRIEDLLNEDDLGVLSGAARSARTYILTNEDYGDRLEWAQLFIASIEKNRTNPKSIRSVVHSLGYTRTDEGKQYLFDLYTEYQKSDEEVAALTMSALGQHIDKAMFQAMILGSSSDSIAYRDKYGFELVRKNFIKQNTELVGQLAQSAGISDQLAYISAIRTLRDKSNPAYVNRAIELLESEDERIVIGAIRAIHTLLPHEDEVRVLSRFTRRNSSRNIMQVVESYIGIRG